MTDARTPFHDLQDYVAIPRVTGLILSPDGSRLAVPVSTLDPKGVRHLAALWDVDPEGERPARRLTRSAKSEGTGAFLPDNSLLFVSGRPDPAEADPDDDAPPALWLLPAAGGEARTVGTRPGGFAGLAVAREAGTVVTGSPTLPAATDAEDDARRRKQRKDRKVSAILHEAYPVRYWDEDLGPDRVRLLAAAPPEAPGAAGTDEPRLDLRDVTGHVGNALGPETSWTVSADGGTAVACWIVPEEHGSERYTLVVLDLATGERRTLLDRPGQEWNDPVLSPDGRTVAAIGWDLPQPGNPPQPPDSFYTLVDVATGASRRVATGWDRWPSSPASWLPDGRSLVVTADEEGASPVFRIDLAEGFDEAAGAGDVVTRLTTDHGSYTHVAVAPDGRAFALRSAYDAPPAPVRLDTAAPGEPRPLRGPVEPPALPGRLEAVTATAEDGQPLRSWLVLPEGASAESPAPLLLWIHGGPLGSWNAWSWRWNPWIMAAQGYAVLLPDPALSTGYGHHHIARGWSRWGAEPFTDLMTATDAALARPDLDAGRTAAMGGSFGGYMANWVAGHTDRFRGIVTHASLWSLDQFGPTTDAYHYWRREMDATMQAEHSPHLSVAQIRTPMLVIHGDKDYRVPIGEALRLWAELAEQDGGPDGSMPHKFLYFPDENHWILTPQHAIVWYSTVLAFLATTVHGEPWEVPDILR